MTAHLPSGSNAGTALELRHPVFAPPARLGWTYRDRRALCSPYPEPPPDAETIRQQTQARLASAEQHWRRALAWGLRPSAIVVIALLALAGCAHAINPGAQAGSSVLTAIILGLPGTGWALWRRLQLSAARAADPQTVYREAYDTWSTSAAAHEHAELARLADVPEWEAAQPPSHRIDVFGGTLAGWQCLLTTHGASLLAGRPLLVADLSGHGAAADLAALARHAGLHTAQYLLPRDLDTCGLLAMLTPRQLSIALAEAIHAGAAGTTRTDRAVDVRVLEQLSAALAGGGISPARLAAGVAAALGRHMPPGLLTDNETSLIQGSLFGDSYQAQIGPNLVRLDAFLSDLASHAGAAPAAPPPPAYCTVLILEPAVGARTELAAALLIQWLTIQVTAHDTSAPAVIIAGADEITRDHLERLADACHRRAVPLTLMFRHLRDDATAVIGGAATAFMRLGNHHEAEQAASYIGRQHTFVLSEITATLGGDQTTTRGYTETWGHSRTRGSSVADGWTREHPLGGWTESGTRTRSRDRTKSYSWSAELSHSEGTSWSDATTQQRVYEFTVEPVVLQRLPGTALLLAASGSTSGVTAVECHPGIARLPHVNSAPIPVVPQASTMAWADTPAPEPAHPSPAPQWPHAPARNPPPSRQPSQPADRPDYRSQAQPLGWPPADPPPTAPARDSLPPFQWPPAGHTPA